MDSGDPVYWFTHDERWRIVATYRGSDADPREVFVWHAAGLDGGGSSSYIDGVVLRQDDSSTAWTAEPDVLGRRVYPLQNWRADVVAVHDGNMIAERVKYSAYGVPFCVSAADFDADGDVDSADGTAFYAAQGNEDPSADLNLDGVVDFNDILVWIGVHNAGETGGRSVLSRSSIRNRIGYAGYQHDPSITGSGQASGQSKYHVRHRVYDAGIGRWTRRDPLGYVDGMGVYEYVRGGPVAWLDPTGLAVPDPCPGTWQPRMFPFAGRGEPPRIQIAGMARQTGVDRWPYRGHGSISRMDVTGLGSTKQYHNSWKVRATTTGWLYVWHDLVPQSVGGHPNLLWVINPLGAAFEVLWGTYDAVAWDAVEIVCEWQGDGEPYVGKPRSVLPVSGKSHQRYTTTAIGHIATIGAAVTFGADQPLRWVQLTAGGNGVWVMTKEATAHVGIYSSRISVSTGASAGLELTVVPVTGAVGVSTSLTISGATLAGSQIGFTASWYCECADARGRRIPLPTSSSMGGIGE